MKGRERKIFCWSSWLNLKDSSNPWNQGRRLQKGLELKSGGLFADQSNLAIDILNCEDRCGLRGACHSTPNQSLK